MHKMKRKRNNNSPSPNARSLGNVPENLFRLMRLPTRNLASMARVSRNVRSRVQPILNMRRVPTLAAREGARRALENRRRRLRQFYSNYYESGVFPGVFNLRNRVPGRQNIPINTPNVNLRYTLSDFQGLPNNQRNLLINYLLGMSENNKRRLNRLPFSRRRYRIAEGAGLRNAERYNPSRTLFSLHQ